MIMNNFKVKILPFDEYDFDEQNDNLDVQVILEDGRVFAATFFTIENIKALFKKKQKNWRVW